MGNHRVLVATQDAEVRPAAEQSDADELFRGQLERGLAAGYRLASVILGNASEAEDAAQDALERAWRSRQKLRQPELFDAWFQRIVVNACRDRLRRRRSGPIVLPISERDAQRPGGGPDPYMVSTEHAALGGALDLLNPDQRICIALRYYLDLEVDEIARRLGTRPGTVKSRLHRGLNQLRVAWETER